MPMNPAFFSVYPVACKTETQFRVICSKKFITCVGQNQNHDRWNFLRGPASSLSKFLVRGNPELHTDLLRLSDKLHLHLLHHPWIYNTPRTQGRNINKTMRQSKVFSMTCLLNE